jgi:hypothetical protein
MTRGHADTAKCIPLICKLVSHFRYRIRDQSYVGKLVLEVELYGPADVVGSDETVVRFFGNFCKQ